jgi:uncharacterized protein (TIGR04255 family)
MHFADYSVTPAKSEHAIQTATFVCELPAAVSSESVAKVANHYNQTARLREVFPRKTETATLSIKMGNKGVGVPAPGPPVGISFERFAPDGSLELSLSLQERLLSFHCNRYTRWSLVSEEAESILSEVVAFLLPAPGVSVFGLQYVDEFFVSGDYKKFEPSSLFNRAAEFLPPHLFGRSGVWHSNTGWYQSAPDPLIVANLNISLQRRREQLVAQIASAFRRRLLKPIANFDEFSAALKPAFDSLHDENKSMLRVLLTDDARSAIHLD